MAKGQRSRRYFSPEFKAETVELIRSSGRSIPDVCADLDLTVTTVRNWMRRARIDAGEAEGLTIPTGVSSYPVTVDAKALLCAGSSTDPTIPNCVHGRPPALPAGDYKARLYQAHQVVPEPEAIPVRVLP